MSEGNISANAAGIKKERNYYVDNLKAVLITLVVIGHFCGRLYWVKGFTVMRNLIYVFHMPCFIFVTGYLSANVFRDGKFRADKLLSMMWTFLLFKIILYILRWGISGELRFRMFVETEAPWYLFSMIMWYLAVPFLLHLKPTVAVTFTTALALAVGLLDVVGSEFCASRTIVFAPFFCLGLCLSKKRLGDFPGGWKLRILGIALFVACSLVFIHYFPVIKPFTKLFSARSSYHSLKFSPAYIGMFWRFVWYLAAVVFGFCLMQMIPRRRTWFSSIGARTLQIYVLHVLVRNSLLFSGNLAQCKQLPDWVNWVLILGGAVILVVVLGNPLFTKIFAVVTNPPIIKKMVR